MARRTSMLRIALWALGLLLTSAAGSAFAQPLGRATVVPLEAADDALRTEHVAQVEATLQAERMTVVAMHEARDRFTARSRPPRHPSESDVDALARAARDVVEHVAFGRVAQAEKSVREVIARAERTLESLNRETATARQLLDACLSLVRATLQEGRREIALEQATGCRRLVPDLVPSERANPANVIGVLAEADDLLRRMRIGRMSVNSAPESGCAVYVNGRHLGTTPFELDRAAAGEYRVQVECGATPGRVHVVQLGDAPVELLVDTEFDRALVSEPRLSLRYPAGASSEARVVAHAANLGREVGVDDVILVQPNERGVNLLRVRVGQRRLIGRALARRGPDRRLAPQELAAAVVALNEARLVAGEPRVNVESNGQRERAASEPAPAGAPLELAPSLAASDSSRPAPRPSSSPVTQDARELDANVPSDAADASHGRWNVALGALAVAGGAVSYGTSYALSAKRARVLEESRESVRESDSYVARLESWDAARRATYWSASVGVLAVSGGAFALLSASARRLPWWVSAASGALGSALATWGAIEVARGGPCADGAYDRRACGDAREQRDRGALYLLSSAPLLALPLFAWLRPTQRSAPRALLAPSAAPSLGAFAIAVAVMH